MLRAGSVSDYVGTVYLLPILPPAPAPLAIEAMMQHGEERCTTKTPCPANSGRSSYMGRNIYPKTQSRICIYPAINKSRGTVFANVLSPARKLPSHICPTSQPNEEWSIITTQSVVLFRSRAPFGPLWFLYSGVSIRGKSFRSQASCPPVPSTASGAHHWSGHQLRCCPCLQILWTTGSNRDLHDCSGLVTGSGFA